MENWLTLTSWKWTKWTVLKVSYQNGKIVSIESLWHNIYIYIYTFTCKCEGVCWNTNSSTTSNTLDFLWTPSAQQARLLFVWISFINHSRCDLNIQDRQRSWIFKSQQGWLVNEIQTNSRRACYALGVHRKSSMLLVVLPFVFKHHIILTIFSSSLCS